MRRPVPFQYSALAAVALSSSGCATISLWHGNEATLETDLPQLVGEPIYDFAEKTLYVGLAYRSGHELLRIQPVRPARMAARFPGPPRGTVSSLPLVRPDLPPHSDAPDNVGVSRDGLQLLIGYGERSPCVLALDDPTHRVPASTLGQLWRGSLTPFALLADFVSSPIQLAMGAWQLFGRRRRPPLILGPLLVVGNAKP